MAYTMTTEKTEAQTRKDIVAEFTKWNNEKARTVGAYDFPAPEKIGDRAATVRFELRGAPMVLSCRSQDNYRLNLRCLFYAVEAMRMNEKRGIGDTMRDAYAQLAAPTGERSPWDVLQIPPDSPKEVAEASYKLLALMRHPDRGGSNEAMAELNAAIEKVRAR